MLKEGTKYFTEASVQNIQRPEKPLYNRSRASLEVTVRRKSRMDKKRRKVRNKDWVSIRTAEPLHFCQHLTTGNLEVIRYKLSS